MSPPRWQRNDFLPILMIVEWPRLDEHRETHGRAVTALEAARAAGEGKAAALGDLCDVVEQAVLDLGEHFEDEAKPAYAKVRAELEPDEQPQVGPLPVGTTLEEFEHRGAADAQRLHEHDLRTAHLREKAGEDFESLRHLYSSILRPNVLHAAAIVPAVLLAVDEAREAIPA